MGYLATLAFLTAVAPAQGVDRWPAPVPRVFASSDGLFGFKVLPTPDAKNATGTLFTLDASGAEKVVWSRPLVCVPVEVRVSAKGHVATLDVWGTKGKEHSLVLYDRAGKVVADHPLTELFKAWPPEKNPFFIVTVGSIHWTLTTEAGYDLRDLPRSGVPVTTGGSVFALRGVWRETVLFDPDTGKVIFREKLP